MTGSYIAANPNEAHAGGSLLEGQAAGFGSLRTQFAGASQEAAGAAGESIVSVCYPEFESLQVNKINAIMANTGAMGQNLQAGAAGFVATDHQSSTDFGGAAGALPPINRGGARAN